MILPPQAPKQPRVPRPSPALLLAAAALLTPACADPDATPFDQRASPIYHGERETGEPQVVAVIYERAATGRLRLCTGTLITPQAVLTAKHCAFDEDPEDVWTPVPLPAFTVAVTDDVQAPEGADEAVGVADLWTTPGDYASPQALAGDDIAVLLLDAPLSPDPSPLAHTAPAPDAPIQILGFGFTQDDELGKKHRGEATIEAVDEGIFISGGASWTCTGDSGGPAFDPTTGAVLGVTSTGPRGCNVDDSYYTRVDRHAEAIDALLDLAPPCEPAEEICDDATDNDCDDQIDEGCELPCEDTDEGCETPTNNDPANNSADPNNADPNNADPNNADPFNNSAASDDEDGGGGGGRSRGCAVGGGSAAAPWWLVVVALALVGLRLRSSFTVK